MCEWISVKGSLPKELGEYLCAVCYGRNGEIERDIKIVSYILGAINGKYYWDCDAKEFVTHWMELPELPKIEF